VASQSKPALAITSIMPAFDTSYIGVGAVHYGEPITFAYSTSYGEATRVIEAAVNKLHLSGAQVNS
jgi:hypothetical protein